MRHLKACGSALIVLLVTCGGAIALFHYARPQDLLTLTPAQVLLQPDDGRLISGVLALLAWLAWIGWLLLLMVDIVGRARGSAVRVTGLGWAQSVVAALIVAVLAVNRPAAPAHAEVPRPAQITQTLAITPCSEDGSDVSLPDRLADHDEGDRYVVSSGDDLWTIAERLLGDGLRWRDIAAANSQIDDPAHIEAGWSLVIPGWHHTSSAAPASTAPTTSEVTRDESLDQASAAAASGAAGSSTPVEAAPEDAEVAVDAPPVATEAAEASPTAVPSTLPPTGAMERAAGAGAVDALPWLGLGSLAAAGITAGLRLRRQRQARVREPGRQYRHPDPAAQRLEAVLSAHDDTDGLVLIAQAMRAVARHCRDGELPDLAWAELGPDELALHFAQPPGEPPPGFSADGIEWRVSRTDAGSLPKDDGPVAYPGMLPVGQRGDRNILIDLEQAGVLGVVGGVDVIAGLAVTATSCPWSQELELVATGPLRQLVEAGELEMSLVDDAGEAVVTRPYPLDVRVARLDPDRAPSLAPRLAFITENLSRLQPSLGVGVVMPSQTSAWRLDAQAGMLSTPYGDVPLNPIAVAADGRRDLATLFSAVTTTETLTAPWWADDAASERIDSGPTHAVVHPRQEPLVNDPPVSPLVLLLGPIELVGCAGPEPTRARRQCIEYAAWLLEHPGGTASQMADALFVAEGTRRSNMSRLRGWLGTDPDGEPYLPEAYSKRIELHPAVTSDWHQLQMLVAPGINRLSVDTLRAALSLVRGAPLADAAPGQWHWAEPLRSDMVALVRDLGLQLAEVALDSGDIELVRWATARALVAAPEDELLLAVRIRAEARVGNRSEVTRLAWRLTRHARTLGVDLRDDTVNLLQEVVEGQVRARAVG